MISNLTHLRAMIGVSRVCNSIAPCDGLKRGIQELRRFGPHWLGEQPAGNREVRMT